MWRFDNGHGRGSDARGDRHWDPDPRRNGGGLPTACAGAAAGSRFARWDAGRDSDGPAMELLELGIAGPVVTPVPGQPDVAYDWWLSSLWEPPSPVTDTAWRNSLTSGKVVGIFGHDEAVNWAEVGPPEITAAMMEYARIGLAGVVPPCLESPRTRSKRFHTSLRRVLRKVGRPIHVSEHRGRD